MKNYRKICTMNDLQTKIVALTEKSKGSISWDDLMLGLEYREQQDALKFIRPLEKEGVLHRIVSHDTKAGKTSLTIKIGKAKTESAK